MDVNAALASAWANGVSYEQALELTALAVMSREEFETAMLALDAECEATIGALAESSGCD